MTTSPLDYTRCSELLLPFFKPQDVDLLQYTCALLRVGGKEDEGWDSLSESREMLDDLIQLNQLQLPVERFHNPDKTHLRLHLLSYGHLMEMSAPFHMLANLLRIRVGMRYSTRPFRESDDYQSQRPRKAITRGQVKKFNVITPTSKIGEIKMLATKAGYTDFISALDSFYFPQIRNAIAHSTYVIHGDEFRMLANRITDETDSRKLISMVPIARLEGILSLAYDFYTAFFTLEDIARTELKQYEGKLFPYDDRLKGIGELLFNEEKALIGFRIYWPNGQKSIYKRHSGRCESLNIIADPVDGSIDFFAGKKFPNPHPFSPLLAADSEPNYKLPENNKMPLPWKWD